MQVGPVTIPRRDQCRVHMPEARILKHRKTDKCNKATEMEMAVRCGEIEFSLEGEEEDKTMESVVMFK